MSEELERLPDPSDQATQHEERFVSVAIAQARRGTPIPATGCCLSCGAELEMDKPQEQRTKRWCDDECRDDWQRIERMKAITGR